jgi:diaminohydroxyphosphoribosylaminopyrimidine deaminase/5-amino-6-(5-phosphoribosylamino)uracil reductase
MTGAVAEGRAGYHEHQEDADMFAPIRNAPADRPFVVAQLGQSLDGRIATLSGESKYINGTAALDHLHRLRAEVDAVIVGAATIEADDPLLTVRRVIGKNPARIVIDPRGRLAAGKRWQAADGAQVFVITTASRVACDAQIIQLQLESNGLIAPARIIDALAERGLRRILVEGGARTISAFINAGCVDRLHILMAPVILGSGRQGLDLAPITHLREALRPPTTAVILAGGEVLFDCALK